MHFNNILTNLEEGYVFLFVVTFYWMTESMDFSEMHTCFSKKKVVDNWCEMACLPQSQRDDFYDWQSTRSFINVSPYRETHVLISW